MSNLAQTRNAGLPNPVFEDSTYRTVSPYFLETVFASRGLLMDPQRLVLKHSAIQMQSAVIHLSL